MKSSQRPLKSMSYFSLVTRFIFTQAACKSTTRVQAGYMVSANDEGNGSIVSQRKFRAGHSVAHL